MDIGGGEWLVIIFVILLLFGSDKIPELARGLGRGINEFKRATDEIKREITEEDNHLRNDISQVNDAGIREIKELKNTVSTSFEDEPTQSVKEPIIAKEINSTKKEGGKRNTVADVYDGEGI